MRSWRPLSTTDRTSHPSGKATVRDDRERIDWAFEWVYDRYDDEPEADGSDESDAFTDESDETPPDGGESDASESGSALVEVEIGSVSWNVYG